VTTTALKRSECAIDVQGVTAPCRRTKGGTAHDEVVDELQAAGRPEAAGHPDKSRPRGLTRRVVYEFFTLSAFATDREQRKSRPGPVTIFRCRFSRPDRTPLQAGLGTAPSGLSATGVRAGRGAGSFRGAARNRGRDDDREIVHLAHRRVRMTFSSARRGAPARDTVKNRFHRWRAGAPRVILFDKRFILARSPRARRASARVTTNIPPETVGGASCPTFRNPRCLGPRREALETTSGETKVHPNRRDDPKRGERRSARLYEKFFSRPGNTPSARPES